MRRPGFWIIVGLVLAAVGVALGWSSLSLIRDVPVWEDRLRAYKALSFFGFLAILLGLILAAVALTVRRKYRQLEAGTNVVGRWRVGMFEWAAFRRRDAARDGLFPSLRNRLRLPEELPPEGLEIRIGKDAMLVGDGCYGLGYFASRGKLVDVYLVEGQPPMLEFTTWQQSKNSARLVVFRVPAPGAARTQAQAVLDHFRQAIDPKRRDNARSRFATHFQAATGDAGEAEAARAEYRRHTWRGLGITGLFVGGLLLIFALSSARGLNATSTALTLYITAGALLAIGGGFLLTFSGRR